MAMVQVATRVPEEIRDEVAKVAGEIGLDVPTILRMSMYKVANEHEIPYKSSSQTAPKRTTPRSVPPELMKKIREKSNIIQMGYNEKTRAWVLPKDAPQSLIDWVKNG